MQRIICTYYDNDVWYKIFYSVRPEKYESGFFVSSVKAQYHESTVRN